MFAELLADLPRLVVLLGLIVVNVITSTLLVRAALARPNVVALSERAELAVFLLAAETLAFVLYLDRRLVDIDLGPDGVQWLAFAMSVLLFGPALAWLVIYLRGGFDG